MRSEFEFVDMIRRRQMGRRRNDSVVQGIGDDAAILRQGGDQDTLVTSDLLAEGVDFDRDRTIPRFLGHKTLAVSLSDIAAMGGQPRSALLSLGMPVEVWRTKFLDHFFEGYFALANRYRITLVGGDVSRTPDRIVLDSTVVGTISRDRSVLRSGARPGDHIFVTGKLGGAAAGLRLINERKRLNPSRYKSLQMGPSHRLLLRQLRPEPRVAWGETLSKSGLATSMIDISDGLSSDLAHLCCESVVGALIERSSIPVDPLLGKFCRPRSIDPVLLALNGGEDFELLFTVAPGNLRRLPRVIGRVPVTDIGTIVDAPKCIRMRTRQGITELEPTGFRHF